MDPRLKQCLVLFRIALNNLLIAPLKRLLLINKRDGYSNSRYVLHKLDFCMDLYLKQCTIFLHITQYIYINIYIVICFNLEYQVDRPMDLTYLAYHK